MKYTLFQEEWISSIFDQPPLSNFYIYESIIKIPSIISTFGIYITFKNSLSTIAHQCALNDFEKFLTLLHTNIFYSKNKQFQYQIFAQTTTQTGKNTLQKIFEKFEIQQQQITFISNSWQQLINTVAQNNLNIASPLLICATCRDLMLRNFLKYKNDIETNQKLFYQNTWQCAQFKAYIFANYVDNLVFNHSYLFVDFMGSDLYFNPFKLAANLIMTVDINTQIFNGIIYLQIIKDLTYNINYNQLKKSITDSEEIRITLIENFFKYISVKQFINFFHLLQTKTKIQRIVQLKVQNIPQFLQFMPQLSQFQTYQNHRVNWCIIIAAMMFNVIQYVLEQLKEELPLCEPQVESIDFYIKEDIIDLDAPFSDEIIKHVQFAYDQQLQVDDDNITKDNITNFNNKQIKIYQDALFNIQELQKQNLCSYLDCKPENINLVLQSKSKQEKAYQQFRQQIENLIQVNTYQ